MNALTDALVRRLDSRAVQRMRTAEARIANCQRIAAAMSDTLTRMPPGPVRNAQERAIAVLLNALEHTV